MIEKLKQKLSEIGYRLAHRGCDHYEIFNHNNIGTGWMLWDNKLSKDGTNRNEPNDETSSVYFDLKFVDFKVIDGDCLTISEQRENPKIFIQFYNHDKKRE